MECFHQIIFSTELNGIFEIPPSLKNKKVQVIILPAEDEAAKNPKPLKRPIGFLKDKIPPLPDSFFDPLPEEDLQAWGL